MTDSSERNRDNITAIPNQMAIKEEAGAWLVRMDQGELTSAETAQLKEWLSRSQFHQQYLEKLAHNWDSMAILQELADLFPISGLNPEPEPQADRVSLTARLLSYLKPQVLAASAVFACALLVAVFLGRQQPLQNLAAPIGEQASYQLEDGSTVTLNTDSHINVDFTGEWRVVRLLQGEANFEVAKDPRRPFVVYAGNGMVWAVGTAFNVRYTSDLVDVVVTEGTVKVYTQVTVDGPAPALAVAADSDRAHPVTAGHEAIVSAGESLQYGQVIQAVEPTPPVELEQKLAWQQGALIFKGESLEQVLAEVGRYTDKELIIVDPAIKDIRVGGHFKTGDIDGLLATLSQGFNFSIIEADGNRIFLSKNTVQ